MISFTTTFLAAIMAAAVIKPPPPPALHIRWSPITNGIGPVASYEIAENPYLNRCDCWQVVTNVGTNLECFVPMTRKSSFFQVWCKDTNGLNSAGNFQ